MKTLWQYSYIFIISILLLSCGGGSRDTTSISTPPSSTEEPAQPEIPPDDERPQNTQCVPPTPATIVETVTLEKPFPQLPVLENPVAMVQAINDDNFWLVAERQGVIKAFSNNAAVSTSRSVLDISTKVASYSEFGLTGLAIHPDYPNDARVFVFYSDRANNAGGRSTLSSFTINTENYLIDPESETVLLTLDQPTSNHNGGDLAFGNDGMLYTAFGDGGADREQSQNLGNLHGALLRIDVSGTEYSIPSDNPYNSNQSRCNSFDASRTMTCPEIFAHGFRNPWRFSIDPINGDIWLADVGETSFEEVNRITHGGNYGWPITEGPNCYANRECDQTGLQAPVSSYSREGGRAIVGGYVYRGTQSPALQGQYIFGDIVSTQLYRTSSNAAPGTSPTEILVTGRTVTAMAQGNDGELYLLNFDGSETGDSVSRIVAAATQQNRMPDRLSDTACFDTENKTSPSGVVGYSINAASWSDGAAKRRSFAIPDASQINVDSDGDFEFPENTILIKHFLNQDTFLETRMLVNHENGGWRGYSYEWNDEQNEATLLNEGKTKDVGDFIHTYPSPTQCFSCHTSAAKTSLGPELAQFNNVDNTGDENVIDRLSRHGYFTTTQRSDAAEKLYALNDTTATVDERVRSYLHSNCSSCHRPGALAGFMDLRFSTAFNDMNLCNVDATRGDLGIPGMQRFAPGNPNMSALWLRMLSTEENERMPPLASLRVDTEATALIQQWISDRNACE